MERLDVKNKYYQPSIEEFHIGFRCEIQTSWGYSQGTYPEILEADTLTGFALLKNSESDVLKQVYESIRVKYLDKADIEELGWKHYKTHAGTTTQEFQSKDARYFVSFNPNFSTEWNITISDEVDFILFHGYIKNYNSLKTLMQQLNIIK